MSNCKSDFCKNYLVLEAKTIAILEDKVRYWLEVGYELLGVPFATDNSHFYQAIVRVKSRKK